MRNAKIDLQKMRSMLRAGKSQKQCSEYFRCSKAAISQAVKSLNRNVAKVSSFEVAGKIYDSELGVVDQLKSINTASDYLLNLILDFLQGDPEAVEALKRQQKDLQDVTHKDPKDILIRTISEIRKNVGMQVNILEILYNIESIQSFQNAVIEAIGEESVELRDKVLHRLKQQRLLRQSVTYRR